MTLGQLLNSHSIFKRLANVAHTTLLEISCRGSNLQPRLTFMGYVILSYDVASGSEITPCNKICKPLVVYRFTGNVITSITTLRT